MAAAFRATRPSLGLMVNLHHAELVGVSASPRSVHAEEPRLPRKRRQGWTARRVAFPAVPPGLNRFDFGRAGRVTQARKALSRVCSASLILLVRVRPPPPHVPETAETAKIGHFCGRVRRRPRVTPRRTGEWAGCRRKRPRGSQRIASAGSAGVADRAAPTLFNRKSGH
jgi:hypothetical protein